MCGFLTEKRSEFVILVEDRSFWHVPLIPASDQGSGLKYNYYSTCCQTRPFVLQHGASEDHRSVDCKDKSLIKS